MSIAQSPRAERSFPTGARRFLAASVAALLLFPGMPVTAADPSPAPDSGIMLDGKVKHPQRLTVDMLRNLPSERVAVAFQTGHGTEKASYTGLLLWVLLEEAGGIDDPAKGAELHHTITITGRDGY